MNLSILVITGVAVATTILFLILFIRTSVRYKAIYNRFKDIVDIEKEKDKVKKQYDKMLQDYADNEAKLKKQETELIENYQQKRTVYDNLMREVSILEENMDFISYGIYNPHFDFDTSDKYKEKLVNVRSQQKEMIRSKQAAICNAEWTVSGSKAEGREMTNKNIKLILRAFNNECDASTLKVRWNNVQNMEQRINKAFEAMNKLGAPNQIEVTYNYLRLKMDELHLAHEYQEKLYQEKEEQRRIKQQMREESKVQKEIEKAQLEAEKEELSHEKALEKARNEMAEAHGGELQKLNEKMKLLEEKLKEAREAKERAISRAQQTKSGHVYIISNLGSFGENVCKIGMTRRLEPLDRVKELGDASVPFGFDIHAMIYSENAPELENKLHYIFNDRRLNLVNKRKEFFYVTLDEINKAVTENKGEIEFTMLAEAKEYRESLAIRGNEKLKAQQKSEIESKFPETL